MEPIFSSSDLTKQLIQGIWESGIVKWILIVFVVGLILNIIKAKTTKNKFNYKYQKRNLLTNNELNFYKSLSQIATKRGFILFTKIRIADLIEPQKGTANWQASQNKITQKHVDFVLCDSIKINPILAIELDDKTHDREDRKQRDAFVDEALEAAGIPILHTRNTDKLEESIISVISPKVAARK